ncbi:MAG: hypothetical protein LBD20_10015 [Spirochaetaceae bacterium]|jgi:tetratricopeptide (TPR) repeat protein|nr:hypothetical protein [Spirochaetaceae bacterium]
MSKKRVVLTGLLFCAGFAGIFAQIAENGTSLSHELQKINAVLINIKASEKDRHDALVRKARIQLLTGDIEAAAETWERAAYVESGKRDDTALLETAACYMAMGEWDKAEAIVRIVLLTVRDDRKSFLKAKYLNAQIETFRSGDPMILDTFISDIEFAPQRAAIYYTLWKITGYGEYKNRLFIEYPESPETKSLLIESGLITGVNAFPGPMWLLPSSWRPDSVRSSAQVIQLPAGELETAALPSVQTGMFTTKNNAVSQQIDLKTKGFEANVILRQVGGNEYWTVIVPSGSNLNETAHKLKEAGFEALPLL